MNNRRSFFKSLIGLIVAPKVVEALPTELPEPSILKARWSVELEQDLLHMHGIESMILSNMTTAIQEEIDKSFIKITNENGELV